MTEYNFSAALGLLQGLLQAEEGGSDSTNQTKIITDNKYSILTAESLSENAALFWQASADANISVNALSRYPDNSPLETSMHLKGSFECYEPLIATQGPHKSVGRH